MFGCGRRVVEETQRDPAGMEGGVDMGGHGGGRRAGAELIGVFEIAAIEPFARHHAPLRPPFVGIDQLGGIMGRQRQPGRGVGRAVGAPRVLHAGEQQAWVGLQRGGHGGDGARRKRAAHRLDARVRQRDFVGSRQSGGAHRGPDIFGIEQAIGAVFMISAGQEDGEFLEHFALGAGFEVAFAPQPADQPCRLVLTAARHGRACRGENPSRRVRRILREHRLDRGRGGMLAVEPAFLHVPHPVGGGPVLVGGLEGGEPIAIGAGPQRHPFERGALQRIRNLRGEPSAPTAVALAIERRGRGEALESSGGGGGGAGGVNATTEGGRAGSIAPTGAGSTLATKISGERSTRAGGASDGGLAKTRRCGASPIAAGA